MKESWDKAIELILGFEDPGLTGVITTDAGGRTRYGIAEKYNSDAWKDGPPSLETAKAIYKERYWNAMKCDGIPYPLDIAVFNCAVNPGPGACKQIMAYNPTLNSFMRALLRWYARQCRDNKHLLQYLPGWILRVLNLWRKLEPTP